MPSKNKYWHKAWHWSGCGALACHESGLLVVPQGASPRLVGQAMASVLHATAHESARGVHAHQMPARISALRREGLRWMNDPRNAAARGAAKR